MRTSLTCMPASSHLTRAASPPIRVGDSGPVRTTCHLGDVPVAVQEQILTRVLTIAEQATSEEREVAYVAFIRLVHCWPECRHTSFRSTARIRLVSQVLHETNSHLRSLIHDALRVLKNADPLSCSQLPTN